MADTATLATPAAADFIRDAEALVGLLRQIQAGTPVWNGQVEAAIVRLIQRHPRNPASYDLAATCSQWGNYEAAKVFLANRLRLEATAPAKTKLQRLLALTSDRRDGAKFIAEVAGRSFADLRQSHIARARRHFAAGDFAAMDADLQIANCFLAVGLPPFPSLAAIDPGFRPAPEPDTVGYADAAIDRAADNPDHPTRAGFARMIADRCGSGAVTILEIGCYIGTALLAIEREFRARGLPAPKLAGIEPVRAAIAEVRERHPQIAVVEGTAEQAAAGQLDAGVPHGAVDLMCLSGTAVLLPPAALDGLFAWARRKARAIGLADDIVNTHGAATLYRPNGFALHPYKSLLERHGFALVRVEMASLPDRVYTGYLFAENTAPPA